MKIALPLCRYSGLTHRFSRAIILHLVAIKAFIGNTHHCGHI